MNKELLNAFDKDRHRETKKRKNHIPLKSYEAFEHFVATHKCTFAKADFSVNKTTVSLNGSGKYIFYEYDIIYYTETDFGVIKYKESIGGEFIKKRFWTRRHKDYLTYPDSLKHIGIAEDRFRMLREALPDVKVVSPLDGLHRHRQKRIRKAMEDQPWKSLQK